MNHPDPLSVVLAEAMVTSGTLFFLLICSSPDLCVVKNAEAGTGGTEPRMNRIVSLAHCPFEKQANKANRPFSSEAPVVI